MGTKNAKIKRHADGASLVLNVNGQAFEIILTEDNPNKIKSVFNGLLKELKKGKIFSFELDDESNDLYHDICVEYLKQLNTELESVYEEMKDFDIFEK